MKKIVFVGPSQPSRNPRLVRNADTLAAHGFDVTVVSPVYITAQREFDEALTARSAWRYVPVDLSTDANTPLGLEHRLRKKLWWSLCQKFPIPSAGTSALAYGAKPLAKAAATLTADFYIAQQQSCLPLVAQLAAKHGKPFACDIEDILTESSCEPQAVMRAVEKKYLPSANLIMTMSGAARDYLEEHYQVGTKTLVLHNSPGLAERGDLLPPNERPPVTKPSIYWFGQTLGPHSCALELIKANARAGAPFQLHFRGRPLPDYQAQLIDAATAAGVPDSFEILPFIAPDRMVIEAGRYQILFGSQPSDELFHQLAIGNKVCTGQLAGCALLLSDTIAHRQLQQQLEHAVLVNQRDEASLAACLSSLSADGSKLLHRQQCSWDWGTQEFNWDVEGARLCHAVNQLLS